MKLRAIFKSRDSRNALEARTALRAASDDVRETLHDIDVELSRETDAKLVMHSTSIVRDALAILRAAVAFIHKQRRNKQ
jgi:hypothetical protein